MFLNWLSENWFEILWHYVAQYIDKGNVSQFFQNNIIFEQYGPNLAQNYTTHINYSKDF